VVPRVELDFGPSCMGSTSGWPKVQLRILLPKPKMRPQVVQEDTLMRAGSPNLFMYRHRFHSGVTSPKEEKP